MRAKEMGRLGAKTPEQRFRHTLQAEYAFSPKMAELLLEEAEQHLLGKPGYIRPGQMRVILAARGARHGQALRETMTREVVWTVDAGEEDREVLAKEGAVVLRRVRLQRLLDEALEQDAMATQEDLAQVLQVTTRTIKRDFATLHAEGEWLPSRGYLKGIGRGQSHKAQIVSRWLNGESYDQLERHTHHTGTSIRRYVQTFIRVHHLHQQGFESAQIATLVQIGHPLVEEYLALWQENDTPTTRERLADQLQRLQRQEQPEKKVVL